jgi:hypothetical protein
VAWFDEEFLDSDPEVCALVDRDAIIPPPIRL